MREIFIIRVGMKWIFCIALTMCILTFCIRIYAAHSSIAQVLISRARGSILHSKFPHPYLPKRFSLSTISLGEDSKLQRHTEQGEVSLTSG